MPTLPEESIAHQKRVEPAGREILFKEEVKCLAEVVEEEAGEPMS